jgi:ABC-type microcin C transport system permease subunit YejB
LDEWGKSIEKLERFKNKIAAPVVLGMWATLFVYLVVDTKTSSSAKK